VEIVEAIFRFLVCPDQICFALNCKGIYAIYAQQKHLNSAPIFESVIQKTDLRLRLQNKRWIYCTQCSIPHWYSAWRKIQSWLSLNHTDADCRSDYQIGIALPSRDKSTFASVLLCHFININYSHIYVEIQLIKLYSNKKENTRNPILTSVTMKPLSNLPMNVPLTITHRWRLESEPVFGRMRPPRLSRC
jgi:hypothetical protein